MGAYRLALLVISLVLAAGAAPNAVPEAPAELFPKAAAGWIIMVVGSGACPGIAYYAVSPNTTWNKRMGTISVATSTGKKNVTVTQTP